MPLDALNEMIRAHIPIAGDGMKITFTHYENGTLFTACPGACNQNDKGTLFAGSLYSLCCLAGWGLGMLSAQEWGITTPVCAVVDAHCVYRYPVTGDTITVSVRLTEPPRHDTQNGKITLFVQGIIAGKNRKGMAVEAVIFNGTYLLKSGTISR